MIKTVHLIRHGQSTFNAVKAETGIDPMYPDAPLTSLGRRQVEETRREIASHPYQIAVTTPLTRAIETCLGLFSGRRVPIVVEALHREFQEESCDIGRSPVELAADYPELSFEHLDDPWWYVGGPKEGEFPVETADMGLNRVSTFREWLAGRPESMIAVVGHSIFFQHLSGHTLDNCEVHILD